MSNSLFAELKRRNVFRVALAYVGVTWLLLQVADVFFPALNLPDWTIRFVAALLILGFPLAIFLAWAYDMTPEGLKRDVGAAPSDVSEAKSRRSFDFLVVGLLVVAATWFALDKFVWTSGSAASPPGAGQPGLPKDTIAVLPFANFSGQDEQEYFSDGLTEELLNLLTQVTDLRVIGRTSSFKFKDQKEDLREIGQQLGAGYLLGGSVRMYDEDVRVTAQLIDANNGVQIWSENFVREGVRAFSLQDSIARAVVSALEIEFLGEAHAANRGPFDPEAYDLYLQGLRLSRVAGSGSVQQSIEFLKQAVAIDPTLVQAWVQLAQIYTSRTVFWSMPPEIGIKRINDAVDRALDLDPESADAYAVRGNARMNFNLDWEGAESDYQRALEIEPNHARALRALGSLAAAHGDFEKALTLTERSRRLDPLNLSNIHNLAFLHYLYRDFEKAEAGFREALELAGAPYTGANLMLSLTLIAAGRPDDALVAAKQEFAEPVRLGALSLVYHLLGETDIAEKTFTEFREKFGGRAAVPVAGNYAQRGNFDKAFEWFEKAYEQRDAQLLWTMSHPVNDVLRGDPRFDELLKKLKLK